MKVPPFPVDYRASGLLLHATSLPSPYGVGDLGPAAFEWIDRLHEAGQRWWQSLPVGPTGYGNSPYQSLSSFAGNELLISPDGLIADGLLHLRVSVPEFPADGVDYGAADAYKQQLVAEAWGRFRSGERKDLRPQYEAFCAREESWLDDYALFRALKAHYGGAHYLRWAAELIERRPDALAAARRELAGPVDQVRFAQFVLSRQADRLKEHARSKGVGLIGDLPFFVSDDSSDVWANPELFSLDGARRPRVVAGVPPDYFSADGQLWGNPVYDWDALRRTGFRWWIDRVRALLAHVDVIRLDHFRGFAAAWHVPAGAMSARTGEWAPGPGEALFEAVRAEIGGLPFIAEDLGVITADVRALRDALRIPGTRLLQFAFDGGRDNPYLPHNFITNTVVYTGTHDNAPTREWYEELPGEAKRFFWRRLGRDAGAGVDAAHELMRLAWRSRAALAIAPLQDLLNLGKEARMNVPGRADGNWRWRCPANPLSRGALDWLRDITQDSGRLGTSEGAELHASNNGFGQSDYQEIGVEGSGGAL
jgi:4-alpha-glucanotransferase